VAAGQSAFSFSLLIDGVLEVARGSTDGRLRLRQLHRPLARILQRLARELYGDDPERASRVAAP
jgi:hypothetical protein